MNECDVYYTCLRDLTIEDINRTAERDCEKPLGVLLTYLRDRFGIPKPDGYPIAEAVLNTLTALAVIRDNAKG